MGKEREPDYRVIKDPAEIRNVVENELKNFQKGFGIEVKTYENYGNLPDSIEKIIEQYYAVSLVMIPNVTSARFPYNEKNSGVVFEEARARVFDRIKRVQREIDLLIRLNKEIESAPEEDKKRLLTYRKLVETDAYNNIVHAYDKPKELGAQDRRAGVEFSKNFSINSHLTHKPTYNESSDEYNFNQKTRFVTINKYIRSSISSLHSMAGSRDISPESIIKGTKALKQSEIDLNNFTLTYVLGTRRALLSIKDRYIGELLNGDYSVVPIRIKSSEMGGYNTENQDVIMFVGKQGNIAVSQWHIGTSRELANSQIIRRFTKFSFQRS